MYSIIFLDAMRRTSYMGGAMGTVHINTRSRVIVTGWNASLVNTKEERDDIPYDGTWRYGVRCTKTVSPYQKERMLDRLPLEILLYIASFTRTVHNGLSLRLCSTDVYRERRVHRLIVTVSIADERVLRGSMQCIKSAVASCTSITCDENGMTVSRPNEFDMLDLILSVRLPHTVRACNWCHNPARKMVSLGFDEVSPSLVSVCSHVASAIVKK